MKTSLFRKINALIICIFLVQTVVAQKGNQYEPSGESLSMHNQSPEWFSDAKLGIYFTWGVIYVPAYGSEWYPWHIYRSENHKVKKHHIETYGDPSKFNYHDFIPDFSAEKIDANQWAKLFKETGAKFAGPCAQHHDGFAIWDSKVNPWNAADRGSKQDLTGKLEKAIKKEGLKFITTFHHARNLQRHNNETAKWETYNSHGNQYRSRMALCGSKFHTYRTRYQNG